MRHSSVILTNSPRLSRLACVIAALVAAFAAWVSFGTIGFDAAGVRIGLLPAHVLTLVVAAGAGLAVLTAGLRSTRPLRIALAISPLGLVLLPWLPLRLPSALLIWTGPVTTLIWVAVAVALAAPYLSAPRNSSPRMHVWAAAVLSLVVFSAAAWFASPLLPGGDEPHYLIITQSLLLDGDLRIENNHRRGDYHAYFAGELSPDAIRRGRNRQLYSIHAPGVPALILPAFALGGYHGVVIFLLLLASAGSALAWWLAWRVTGSVGATWFGWAAVALSPPFLLESYTIYPDGPAATVVLTGIWALLRADWEREQGTNAWRPWLLHGAALAALPWMHTRFAVLAVPLGGLILLRLARGPNPAGKAIAFLTVPAISALAWLSFFITIYGTADPSAPYAGQIQSSFAYVLDGAGGLFFDQGFGLLAAAPVLVLAIVGFRRIPRLALEWTIVAVPYLLAVTTFAMWWAGWSGPARFFVPLLLPLAIPIGAAWASLLSRGVRALAIAALITSCWLSIVIVTGGGGHLGYHTRNDGGRTPAPWIEWALPAIDVPSTAPAFVPLPIGTALAARQAAARDGFLMFLPWVICLGVALLALSSIGRQPSIDRRALAVLTTLVCAVAVTVAVGIGWKLRGVRPIDGVAAQASLLRRLAHDRVLAFALSEDRELIRDELVARMRLDVPIRRAERGAPLFTQPLATIAALPAGEYSIEAVRRGGDGWVMLGVAADQFALLTQPAWTLDAGLRLRFPVDIRTLVVRADDDARQQIEELHVRPLRLLGPGERLAANAARRAVRYGDTTVFFMDERAFPEPSAFWVGGGRTAAVVIAPDRAPRSAALILRNAPVENRVTLESGAWRDTLTLGPEEERRVDVPIDPSSGAALVRITSASGFRPSETGSRDSRYLGVYVRTGN